MANLLMIESWLGSSGRAFGSTLRERGHSFTLATRDIALYDTEPPHPALTHADDVVIVETNALEALVSRCEQLHRAAPFDGVVTTCDYYLEAVARVAESLELPGSPPASVHVGLRKHLVREALRGAGVVNPAFAVATNLEEAIAAARVLGFPLIAKPVDLNAGTGVRRVGDESELSAAVDAIAERRHNSRQQPLSCLVLLEEFLVGQEVSVEAVTVEGRTTFLGITDKSTTGSPAVVESGHMFPARLDPGTAEDIESCVRAALLAIGHVHGLSHTEVMVTSGGARIVEINLRQGGNYIFELVRHVTGIDLLEVMIDLAIGIPPKLFTPPGHERAASAAVFFVMTPVDAAIERIGGIDGLRGDPRVLRWEMPVPVAARRPHDNDDYLGHVLTADRDGPAARAFAEEIVAGVRLHCADGTELTPLGVPSLLA